MEKKISEAEKRRLIFKYVGLALDYEGGATSKEVVNAMSEIREKLGLTHQEIIHKAENLTVKK